jgi:hypothetical protein
VVHTVPPSVRSNRVWGSHVDVSSVPSDAAHSVVMIAQS